MAEGTSGKTVADHSCTKDSICITCQVANPLTFSNDNFKRVGAATTYESILVCNECIADHEHHDIIPENIAGVFKNVKNKLKKGSKLDTTCIQKQDFYKCAVMWKDAECLNESIMHRIGRSCQDGSWMTMLEELPSDIVKQITLNKSSTGATYLHTAAGDGNAKFLKQIFVEKEWREKALEIIDEEDKFGRTALSMAVFGNHHLCQSILLDQGASIIEKLKPTVASKGDDKTKEIICENVLQEAIKSQNVTGFLQFMKMQFKKDHWVDFSPSQIAMISTSFENAPERHNLYDVLIKKEMMKENFSTAAMLLRDDTQFTEDMLKNFQLHAKQNDIEKLSNYYLKQKILESNWRTDKLAEELNLHKWLIVSSKIRALCKSRNEILQTLDTFQLQKLKAFLEHPIEPHVNIILRNSRSSISEISESIEILQDIYSPNFSIRKSTNFNIQKSTYETQESSSINGMLGEFFVDDNTCFNSFVPHVMKLLDLIEEEYADPKEKEQVLECLVNLISNSLDICEKIKVFHKSTVGLLMPPRNYSTLTFDVIKQGILCYFENDSKLNDFIGRVSFNQLQINDQNLISAYIENLFSFAVEKYETFPLSAMTIISLTEHIKREPNYFKLVPRYCQTDEQLRSFVESFAKNIGFPIITKVLLRLIHIPSVYIKYPTSARTLINLGQYDILAIFDTDLSLNDFITHIITNIENEEEEYKMAFIEKLIILGSSVYEQFPKSFLEISKLSKHISDKRILYDNCFAKCSKREPLLKSVAIAIENLESKDLEKFCCEKAACHKTKKATTHEPELHELHSQMMAFVALTYDAKTFYKEEYQVLREAFLRSHDHNKKTISKCIENDPLMELNVKGKIKADIEALLPSFKPFGIAFSHFSSWCKTKFALNILTFASILLNFADTGFDVGLWKTYLNWDEVLKQYNATIINGTTETCFSLKDTTFQPENNATLLLASVVCKLNESVPNQIYAVIFAATFISQYFWLFYHKDDAFAHLIAFFTGHCCPVQTRNKTALSNGCCNFNRVRFYFAMLMMGAGLPFISNLFLKIIAPLQIYKFLKIQKKLKLLKRDTNDRKSLYPTFPNRDKLTHDCICRKCNSVECFCMKCGFTHQGSKIISLEEYNTEIRKEESNLLRLNSINRLSIHCMEDTYIPFLQMYIILPLVTQKLYFTHQVSYAHIEYTKPETYTSYATEDNISLAITLFSIILSILSQSMAVVHLHFSQPKKSPEEGGASKPIFLLAMMLQIICRLSTITMAALILPNEKEYTPWWIILFCMVHIAIVFLVKCCFRIGKEDIKPLVINDFICSTASVFIYTKGEFALGVNRDKESHNEKMGMRLAFSAIIITEHLVMYILMYIKDISFADFNINVFLVVMSIVFVLGMTLEAMVFILYPWSQLRENFALKKYSVLSIFTLIIIGAIAYLVYTVPSLLIPGLTVLSVIAWTVVVYWIGNSSCCTELEEHDIESHGEPHELERLKRD